MPVETVSPINWAEETRRQEAAWYGDAPKPVATPMAVTCLDIPFEDILATVLKVYAAVFLISAVLAVPAALLWWVALR